MEEQITIKIDDEKKTELQRLATSKGLLLSNYIRMVLYEAIEQEKFKAAA